MHQLGDELPQARLRPDGEPLTMGMAGFKVRLPGPDSELKTLTYVVPTIFIQAIAYSIS